LSCVDRSASADDSKLNVESLIENLKNMIMKELSVLCVARSFIFFSSLSVSFSAASSQSSTSASVSDSLTSATPVSVTLTSVTSGFIISAFIISSPQFKKMLYRLNESHLSVITPSLNSIKIAKDIHVFENRNIDVVLFYICECEAHTSYLK
ncbi:hypothetical protein BDDG_13524, partial [Blastomyces dermatitidis ATCC 18188]